MFYKIIKNNMIIDVNNIFLCENKKNHILTETTYEHAHFIISSDRKNIYKASWCNSLENSVYHVEVVEAEIITEAEYTELQQQLQNDVIKYIDKKEDNTIEIVDDSADDVQVLDVMAMKKKILELEALVAQLIKK